MTYRCFYLAGAVVIRREGDADRFIPSQHITGGCGM